MNTARSLVCWAALGSAVLAGSAFGCSSSAGQAPATGGTSALGGGAAFSGAAPSGGTSAAGVAGSVATAGTTSGSGGSLGTSGSAGASAGNAAAGAGTSAAGAASVDPCSARPGLLFCDDFEHAAVGTPNGSSWSTSINGDGTVLIDGTGPAHSGSKSVHVHGSGFQTLLVYHEPAVLPQTNGQFYARAFVRLAEPMTAGHNTFVIADTAAAPGSGNATRLGEMNAMLMMTVGGDAHGYLSNQNYYSDHAPGTVFAPQSYSCLELFFDAPNSEIRVWVDGADVPDLHVTGLAHENYDSLRFGFEKYAGPESDLWYDDIALGSARIGCN